MSPNKTLRERLADWTDVDVAQHDVGMVLGILPPMKEGESEGDHFRRCKSIFWAANGLGDALYESLMALVSVGLIEQLPDEKYGIHSLSPLRFVEKPPTEETPGK